MLDRYPQFIKQQSEKWLNLHKQCRLTGSIMHNALGLQTLKVQKDHYDDFVLSKNIARPVNNAMKHGQQHEVIIVLNYTSFELYYTSIQL